MAPKLKMLKNKQTKDPNTMQRMVARTCVGILKDGAAFPQWDSSEGNQA